MSVSHVAALGLHGKDHLSVLARSDALRRSKRNRSFAPKMQRIISSVRIVGGNACHRITYGPSCGISSFHVSVNKKILRKDVNLDHDFSRSSVTSGYLIDDRAVCGVFSNSGKARQLIFIPLYVKSKTLLVIKLSSYRHG